jgi:hypothetical protein
MCSQVLFLGTKQVKTDEKFIFAIRQDTFLDIYSFMLFFWILYDARLLTAVKRVRTASQFFRHSPHLRSDKK